MQTTLELVLILLAAAVIVAAAARTFKLPTMLGYLVTGIVIGPYALGWLPDSPQTRYLAEFGVVFLMFSVGLEFSLPRMLAMRGIVFGFGGAQVALAILATLALSLPLGLSVPASISLGGALAMSSTAIVSKLLSERVELQLPHGRLAMGTLLFQDLAVVPLLILIPAFAMPADSLARELFAALLKAIAVLFVLLFFGQKIMRAWFHRIAEAKSSELFTLNLLLITLGLAYLTEHAGLSLALGAFLAGMLVSETEYRYQVEDDIKPFRDVLLGLFFVTIGMRLNIAVVWNHILLVLLLLGVIIVGKGLSIWGLTRLFGHGQNTAVRTALSLSQGGEFGLVLLALAADNRLMPPQISQPVLAALVISMLLAPLLIHRMEWITKKLAASDWANRAKEVHDIALKTFGKNGHVVLCGYGRSGQSLARFLEAEGIPFVALDSDPTRVKAAAAAGESVVFGDPSKREVLIAAGISRARHGHHFLRPECFHVHPPPCARAQARAADRRQDRGRQPYRPAQGRGRDRGRVGGHGRLAHAGISCPDAAGGAAVPSPETHPHRARIALCADARLLPRRNRCHRRAWRQCPAQAFLTAHQPSGGLDRQDTGRA